MFTKTTEEKLCLVLLCLGLSLCCFYWLISKRNACSQVFLCVMIALPNICIAFNILYFFEQKGATAELLRNQVVSCFYQKLRHCDIKLLQKSWLQNFVSQDYYAAVLLVAFQLVLYFALNLFLHESKQGSQMRETEEKPGTQHVTSTPEQPKQNMFDKIAQTLLASKSALQESLKRAFITIIRNFLKDCWFVQAFVCNTFIIIALLKTISDVFFAIACFVFLIFAYFFFKRSNCVIALAIGYMLGIIQTENCIMLFIVLTLLQINKWYRESILYNAERKIQEACSNIRFVLKATKKDKCATH